MSTTCQFCLAAHRVFTLCFAALLLDACSSATASFDPVKNVQEVFIAATGPLEDLNLRRQEIPPLLKAASKEPYALPAIFECAPIRVEIAALDQLLGADREQQLDPTTLISYTENEGEESYVPKMPALPEMPDSSVLVDKGIDTLHSRALNFIRDQTNILPFRRIIRTITGAEQHARRAERARQAGLLRRAFLKGIATAKFGRECLAPPVILEVNATPPPGIAMPLPQ